MTSDEKTILSAELALGLLQGAERDEVETAVMVDPEMREAHRRWTEHFAGLVLREPGPDPVPGPQVLAGIEATLFGDADEAEAQGHSWWDWLRAPENRGLVLTVGAAKVALLAWILYLFL
ncbi:hypothetical protein [Pseudooceanicola marinus]|uniref:hypothetical protein n=1 Tax=Pseudooceanicola marinus TaxID=396013 RepID=UPI001CD79215|nr:hypothetical protein [Pseudooceanicola marinus]MCA1334588.1 hypothetical protein [Pseudooceanicola marinus]